jgi:ribosomal protein S11
MSDEYTPVSLQINIDLSGFADPAPADGSIDPTQTYVYADVTTFELSEAKVRGNLRWGLVVSNLNFENTTINVTDIVVTGGSIDTQPTEIEFTAVYPNFDKIYTYDEVDNVSILTGTDAIKRMIARALMTTVINVQPVFDPTAVPTNGTATFPRGFRVESLETGRLTGNLVEAEAAITVTVLS